MSFTKLVFGVAFGVLLSQVIVIALSIALVFGLYGVPAWLENRPSGKADLMFSEVQGLDAEVNAGQMIVSGSVKNLGSKNLKEFLIVTEILEGQDSVVRSQSEIIRLLGPGQAHVFRHSFSHAPAEAKYRARVVPK